MIAPTVRPRPSPLLALVALLPGACATPPEPPLPRLPAGTGAEIPQDPPRRWYATCFRLEKASDGRPEWALDLLLADRVAGPALAEHANDITLWRFHRRAAPDEAGHQFTLLTYASAPTIAALRARFEADPTLAQLRATGRLERVLHGCRANQATPAVEATSDPAWDVSIQRSWPWFIMGVSASWLALVRELGLGIPTDGADPLPAYRAIDARIEALWGAQAQHAYLHHLSGLYGYKPLRIETWMRY
jgi:hypothetical protein